MKTIITKNLKSNSLNIKYATSLIKYYEKLSYNEGCLNILKIKAQESDNKVNTPNYLSYSGHRCFNENLSLSRLQNVIDSNLCYQVLGTIIK